MKTREKPKTDAAPAIGDRLLTLREAAEVLRLSPRTVREYVQRGEIEGRIQGENRSSTYTPHFHFELYF